MTKDLSPHFLHDSKCDSLASAVSKIFFSRSKNGAIEPEQVTIIDRYGHDVTRLFDPIKHVGFEYYINAGFAKAKLRFGANIHGWKIDCPHDLTERMSVKTAVGYDLIDGLEIDSVVELYPRDGYREIEITFDAEWGG